MRWMFFLLIGCGKPGGGMVGSQGLDTATPQSGLGLVAIGGGTFTLGETDPDSYLEHLKPGEIRQVILANEFELNDFLIAKFPFPGVEGAQWFTDGATHSTIEALDAALADFGRRTCTISELMYAAAGPSNKRYPYGNTLQTGLCDPDDENPQPIGTFTNCKSDLGIRDFQVRATWGSLDPQILAILNSGDDQQPIGEDQEYGIWGATSRIETVQAETNFGFHSHGDDPTPYTDVGFRVCADQAPTQNEDLAYERWRQRAVDAGRYDEFLTE